MCRAVLDHRHLIAERGLVTPHKEELDHEGGFDRRVARRERRDLGTAADL